MRHRGTQYEYSVYPFKPEPCLAGSLVEFDPRHALTPQIASRHDASHSTIVPEPYQGWRQQYLASFERCVSYVTHRRVEPEFSADGLLLYSSSIWASSHPPQNRHGKM